MFDKTGTLTVGGARLVAVETAPGESADDVLRLTASLEQASHHVVAAAIVAAAVTKGLPLDTPDKVRETMGSGLEGYVAGKMVRAGSRQLVCGPGRLDALGGARPQTRILALGAECVRLGRRARDRCHSLGR